MGSELKIEYVPITDLPPWPKNPKKHRTEEMKKSMRRFGFKSTILFDTKLNRIVAGHGRLETLEALKKEGAPPPEGVVLKKGVWHVPVIKAVFASESEAKAFLLADNRLNEGGWDEEALKEMLEELSLLGETVVDGLGWSDREIQALLAAHEGTERAQGLQPEEKLDHYLSAAIKQVVLHYPSAEYDEVVGLFDQAMARLNVESYTEVVSELLKRYAETETGE